MTFATTNSDGGSGPPLSTMGPEAAAIADLSLGPGAMAGPAAGAAAAGAMAFCGPGAIASFRLLDRGNDVILALPTDGAMFAGLGAGTDPGVLMRGPGAEAGVSERGLSAGAGATPAASPEGTRAFPASTPAGNLPAGNTAVSGAKPAGWAATSGPGAGAGETENGVLAAGVHPVEFDRRHSAYVMRPGTSTKVAPHAAALFTAASSVEQKAPPALPVI